ncbi:MAG: Eco57I restriction-modification methylase domain-containing protein, partial [Bacteroidaceae bacterium]|nr:Eco57I restriction-modification methylase domain-containing protein [Bacteroidaceae bacterium]
MSEDEPMEREVAIDPEMLGKIFENLLEVKDRKSKGAFYTPREIVHYMCQESLINYLVRKTSLSYDAIRDFVLYGDFMKDEDTVKSKREGNGGMYISPELFKIDDTGRIVTNKLKDIDDALASVRVADPSVGSGAFPLGMVNEIVRARENITAYITIGMNANDKRLLYKNERSPYMLKYNAIRNSIFAVDIEPSAVDITQLRLWLSLVIDDEITPNAANDLEGHRNPLPLPNLECNILCGNSLVDEFMGIKLIKESDLINNMTNGLQLDLGHAGFERILRELLKVQDQLFNCDEPNRKLELKNQIQSLKNMIIDSQLIGCSPEIRAAYGEAVQSSSKPFVLWQLDFARVFRDNGGFDIVIGNPPYLESRNACFSEETKDQLQRIIKRRYDKKASWFPRGADLLIYFFELSLCLICENGINTFITQNSWLDTEFGRKFQDYLLETTNVLGIVDSDFKYFETADINTVITFFEGKKGCKKPVMFARCHKNLKYYPLPIGSAQIDSDSVTYKVLPAQSELLKEMKWGFIFGTDETLFNIIAKTNGKGKSISQLQDFEIGQGLNLKKSNVVDSAVAHSYGVNQEALIPFFVTEEGARYSWHSCSHFLVSKKGLDSRINLPKDYDQFDETGTRKKPPVLILPRGIGARHFCCYNELDGFSSSCVDVYSTNGTKLTDNVLRLWTYMNSSLFWLIREISGRKNLGG